MNRAFSTVLTRMGLVVSVILLPVAALADEVQLVNGDVLSAIVVSLDAKQIKLKSELLGDLTIDRAKVRQITLGERAKPALAATQPAPASSSLPLSDLLKDLLKMGSPAQLTPEGVLKQFEAAGGDPSVLSELKKNLPLLASPEVQDYFRKQVGGL